MCMVVITISKKHLLDLDVINLFTFAKVVCVAFIKHYQARSQHLFLAA